MNKQQQQTREQQAEAILKAHLEREGGFTARYENYKQTRPNLINAILAAMLEFEEARTIEVLSQFAEGDQTEGEEATAPAMGEAVALLQDAAAQIRYLGEKFGETGTGNAVVARIENYLNNQS